MLLFIVNFLLAGCFHTTVDTQRASLGRQNVKCEGPHGALVFISRQGAVWSHVLPFSGLLTSHHCLAGVVA